MRKTCSFCGRSDKEVKLLITGLNGNICEECAAQAYEIAKANGYGPDAKKEPAGVPDLKKVPKPKEIKDYLDQYVIGQDEAKRSSPLLSITTISGCSNPLTRRGWR